MSTQPTDFCLPNLPLSAPLQADPGRERGVYSWWLDTTRCPTPEAAGLLQLPDVPRLVHASGGAELVYVGRARRNLHQRIVGQHLRRTRSSALRRTLLAVLLPGDPSWREGAALDGRGRVVLGEAQGSGSRTGCRSTCSSAGRSVRPRTTSTRSSGGGSPSTGRR
nr:hypothetical protein [Kocuria sp. SM24M-10]